MRAHRLLEVHGVEVRRDDVGNHGLAALLVLGSDHGDGTDAVDLGDHVLDLDRVDVEAGDDDELLDPVDEEHVPALVEVTDVAGRPPSVRARPVGTVGPVAAEQVGATDLDLAGVLGDDHRAALVDQAHVDARQGSPDRAQGRLLGGAQGARDDRRRLGQPVSLMHRHPRALGELGDHAGLEGRRTRQHQPDRAEAPCQVDVAPVGEDGRCDGDDAARLVVDQVERALRVEVVGEHQLGPLLDHAPEDGVEPVDVEERQDPEHDVVAVDHRRSHPGDLRDVGRQRPVGEHRRARKARRTARVEQHRHPLGIREGRHRPSRVRTQVVVGPLSGAQRRTDHHDTDPFGDRRRVCGEQRRGLTHRRDGAALGHDHPGAAVGQQSRHLVGGRARVDGYGDRLGPQHAEIGRDELDPVARGDHHPVAGQDPGRSQTGRDPADLVVELGPGHAATTGLDDRELVGVLARRPGQERRQVERSPARISAVEAVGAVDQVGGLHGIG